ncbi:MAG: cysteine desulfurase family protein [Proteobacteria bacterium]|jgi:cysteine desulfurase|nr:cysteine desulfurase family protein [Pseudomonadota bacterium]
MSVRPIYLDYLATTPIAAEVKQAMLECLDVDSAYGNPASRTHVYGWQAEHKVEVAREQLAQLIGADMRELVFTSGATEANNLAIKGIFEALYFEGHFITSAIEHKAVLDPANYLQKKGVAVSFVPASKDGLVTVEAIERAVRPDTKLISVMYVNNELGTINPIADIAAFAASRGIAFHVDAAQAVGKVKIDLSSLPIDLMSISAHKFYGPKGIGALYIRRGVQPAPLAQVHGGGHERNFRSGTLATHQIAGMGAAAELARVCWDRDQSHYRVLGQRLLEGLLSIEGVVLNGSLEHRLPQVANVSFHGVSGEALLTALAGIAVSSGSACNSATMKPSHVLLGIGADRARADSALRFSIGRPTVEADIDKALAEVRSTIQALRDPASS